MYIITLLLFCILIGFAISGLDDLAIDLVYWHRRLGDRRHRGRELAEEQLRAVPEKRIAILTAAWREHDVIEEMLRFNTSRLDYGTYDFFVGTYPNDPETQAAVDRAAADIPHIVKAVNPTPGPSSKADCLNAAIDSLRQRERDLGIKYDFIVLHDPEDVLHPLELRLYNRIFTTREGVSMIQIPIYPFAVGRWEFTAGAYMDEFAEQHTKNLYAREWADTFVPSAGVATAIRSEALDQIAEDGKIFGVKSLTEDYEIGLRVALSGLSAIFVRQIIAVTDANGVTSREVIATRANFPHTLHTAIRQRTRWTLGIVFQASEHFGWRGSWKMKWMLFHDRKGPWSYALVTSGYLLVLYVMIYSAIRKAVYPEWDVAIPGSEVLAWGLVFSFVLMAHRIMQQVISTSRVYGWKQGVLSIARHPWATLINLIATFRALGQFRRSQRNDAALAWDKTQHYVPAHIRQQKIPA